MLKAGVFDDFKGATTLLLWGNREGMAALATSFSALLDGTAPEFSVEGREGVLTVSLERRGSTVTGDGKGVRWGCSREAIASAADLLKPLLSGAGHQFLDVDGLADQVVISRDEYPDDLR